MKITLEICCGSYIDAVNACKNGANRIELNSALYLGGLTPSVASLKLIKKDYDIPVVSMIRMRAGGFCYLEEEYMQMYEEAKALIEAGTDSICFGFLNEDYTLDIKHMMPLINLCKEHNIPYVFHRAFDLVNDPFKVTEELIELGFTRILTSGLKAKAYEGKDTIKELQEKYGSKIEFLAGSGVNKTNACELIKYTKINQVHSSAKDYFVDKTTTNNDVSYNYLENDKIEYVNGAIVRELRDVLNTIE